MVAQDLQCARHCAGDDFSAVMRVQPCGKGWDRAGRTPSYVHPSSGKPHGANSGTEKLIKLIKLRVTVLELGSFAVPPIAGTSFPSRLDLGPWEAGDRQTRVALAGGPELAGSEVAAIL